MNAACIDKELIEAARRTAEAIRKVGFTVVTAESCTGGLVSAALSHAEDASELLQGSFVVYTKGNKTAALGVDKQLLSTQGAVCEEVAAQMACGALARSPATLALSVTGVLGPDPDEDGNPVGRVCFSLCTRDGKPESKAMSYAEDHPDALRRRVTLDALHLLRDAALCATK